MSKLNPDESLNPDEIFDIVKPVTGFKTLREIAEDLGYQWYYCHKHGSYWSDSGPGCAVCEDEKGLNIESNLE